MRFIRTIDGSDMERSATYGVSIEAFQDSIPITRNVLVQNDDLDISRIITWSRKRMDYGRPIYEQLFAPLENTRAQAEIILRTIRTQFEALLCAREARPDIRPAEGETEGAMHVEYYSDYRELLPYRFRISAELAYAQERKAVDFIPWTKPEEKEKGPLSIAFIQYDPRREEPVLQHKGKGLFKSMGTQHALLFKKNCMVDPLSLYVPHDADMDPSRILRRKLRGDIEDMLNDTFVKEEVR